MTTRLEGHKTRFLPFNKDIDNPINPKGPRSHYLWGAVLTPDSLLDIVEHFARTDEANHEPSRDELPVVGASSRLRKNSL